MAGRPEKSEDIEAHYSIRSTDGGIIARKSLHRRSHQAWIGQLSILATAYLADYAILG